MRVLVKKQTKFLGFFALLDCEEGTKGVITKGDISIFLSSKDIKKKKITEEDVIHFLKRVREVNPIEKEVAYSQMNFVDENNKKIITKEMYSLFGESDLSFKNFRNGISENGKIKQGFEIFDLNGDGNFDQFEEDYYYDNSDVQKGYDILKTFLTSLDKIGSNDGTTDNVITVKDKQKAYNGAAFKRLQYIKFESGEKILTPEIIALFENGAEEVKFDDMLTADGCLKSGFELFDINGDGKLDDIEKIFFSSGGHTLSDDFSKLNINNLISAIKAYDKFGISGGGNNRENYLIKSADSHNLYNAISSAHYMLDVVKNYPEVFPKEIQQMYIDALKEVRIIQYVAPCSRGACEDDYVGVNYHGLSKYEIASVLIHELTHYILNNKKGMGKKTSMQSEVETFYVENKLIELEHKLERENPDFEKACQAPGTDLSFFNNKYNSIFDEIKRKNPNLSEKEVALETFLRTHFTEYNGRYKDEKYTPDEFREAVKNNKQYLMLK